MGTDLHLLLFTLSWFAFFMKIESMSRNDINASKFRMTIQLIRHRCLQVIEQINAVLRYVLGIIRKNLHIKLNNLFLKPIGK